MFVLFFYLYHFNFINYKKQMFLLKYRLKEWLSEPRKYVEEEKMETEY